MKITLDAFKLKELKLATGIDLADLSAGGLDKIMTDVIALAEVVAELVDRETAASLSGEKITEARQAIKDALIDFFPVRDWSAIQSHLQKREAMAELQAMVAAMDGMPQEVKDAAMAAMATQIASGDSQPSTEASSAGGQGDTPSVNVSDELESLASIQEGLAFPISG